MTKLRSSAASLFLAFCVGCGGASDLDAPSSAGKRTPDRTSEASEYAKWLPTPEQRAALEVIKSECKGNLKRLLDQPKWSGSRLRMTGMRRGLPVTENIGPWHIALFPLDKHVVEIRGLLFAKGFSVKLDMDRDVLIVNDVEFKGAYSSGESPMFQNVPFQGVNFKKARLGPTMGSASILFLDDGRIAMDFYKVVVNGSKAGEYGVLKGDGASK